MNDGAPLPRGLFRAVLVDKGGSRSERTLSFDGPLRPRYAFPQFTVSRGRYLVVSSYPVHRVLLYNGSGDLIASTPLDALEGPVEAFGDIREAVSAALWAEDGEHYSSALTAAAALR